MGTIIAVENQKGGVGKTTSAVCLGGSLAKRGKRVCLVDMDPDGHGSTWLSYRLGPDDPSVFDLIVGNKKASELVRPVKYPDRVETIGNLFIIPSSPALAGMDLKLAEEPGKETLLRDNLHSLRNEFDYILIDCPPNLGVLASNALTAADFVLIPMALQSTMNFNGLVKLKGTIDAITKRLNKSLKVMGILPCILDRRENLGPALLAELQSKAPYRVLKTTVRKNVRIAEAPSFGLPVEQYAPDSPGAEDYRALAEEFIQIIENERGMSHEKNSDQQEPARLVG